VGGQSVLEMINLSSVTHPHRNLEEKSAHGSSQDSTWIQVD